MDILKLPEHGLQLFADGGAGGAPGAGGEGGGAAQSAGVTGEAAAPRNKGVKSNPLANVIYGKQAATPAAEVSGEPSESPEEPNATNPQRSPQERQVAFQKLISEDYKDLYDANVQNIVRSRLKGEESQRQELESKMAKLSPLLDAVAMRHGLQADNIDGLVKAVTEDGSYLEAEAMRRNMSTDQLRHVLDLEHRNRMMDTQLQAQMQERQVQAWNQEALEVKDFYPDFDFSKELENDQFKAMLRSGVGVKAAYQALHFNDLVPAAMAQTAKVVESKIANAIATGGKRPAESALAAQIPATVKADPSKWTRDDRKEVMRRVARGERIVL